MPGLKLANVGKMDPRSLGSDGGNTLKKYQNHWWRWEESTIRNNISVMILFAQSRITLLYFVACIDPDLAVTRDMIGYFHLIAIERWNNNQNFLSMCWWILNFFVDIKII